MRRTLLPVKLQHDAGTFWGIIIFTRNCKMLPFEHDVVQKGKKVSQRSTSNLSEILMWRTSCKIMKRYWQFLQIYRFHKAACPWASLKVQKGHTKINIEFIVIFMWRILLSSYNLIQAIYEELLRSQGPPRCCVLESFKKGHTKVKIKLGWNFDE